MVRRQRGETESGGMDGGRVWKGEWRVVEGMVGGLGKPAAGTLCGRGLCMRGARKG